MAKKNLTLHMSVNLCPEDKKIIERAAALADETRASRWVRKVALAAAREALATVRA